MSGPLIYFAPHTRALRIFWALEELGRPYEAKPVAFPPVEKEPEFLKVNPSGSLPAFVDGDVFLTESMAIAEHVATGTPLMVAPGEKDRADFLQWLWFGESSLMTPVGTIVRVLRIKPREEAFDRILEASRSTLRLKLAALEERLEGREFVAADRLTLADISCAYPLYLLPLLKEDGAMGPNVNAYWQRVSARPAFQTAIAVR